MRKLIAVVAIAVVILGFSASIAEAQGCTDTTGPCGGENELPKTGCTNTNEPCGGESELDKEGCTVANEPCGGENKLDKKGCKVSIVLKWAKWCAKKG